MSVGSFPFRTAASQAKVQLKQSRLRRMRWLATSLLGLMLVLLALSALYQARHPWLAWTLAFAEAGAVGAMADWYAVTALFRRPLGLPIAHTAIIPANKDRIGETLGDFVERNFLTPENIIAKVRQYDAARSLAQWLSERGNSAAVASALADFIPAVLSGLTDDGVRRFLDRALTPQLLRINVARAAGHGLSALVEHERHQALLDWALRAAQGRLIAWQPLIEAKFGEASPYTPRLVDHYVVSKFVQGAIALSREVIDDPQHELRGQFDQAVRALIDDLLHSERYRRTGKVLLRRLVRHVQTESFYQSLWDDVRSRVAADLQSDSSLIRRHIADALTALGERLLEAPGVREKLNAWWIEAARLAAQRFRHQISGLITDVVKSWDAEQISREIELEIGKDLQYIRINGTLVGGAVGLLLHAGRVIAGVA